MANKYNDIKTCFFEWSLRTNDSLEITFINGEKITFNFFKIEQRVEVMTLLIKEDVDIILDKRRNSISIDYEKAKKIVEN